MDVTIRKAVPEDAAILAWTRRIVWEQTYRGIYPNEKLDDYNLERYTQKDRNSIEKPQNHYYLFLDGNKCVGYFSFGPYHYGSYKDFCLCLNHLYICEGYKGRGLGRTAFSMLCNYALQQGIDKFFCGCNAHNEPAKGFYKHMGGQVGSVSTGHQDKSDDIIHFEFYLGDKI